MSILNIPACSTTLGNTGVPECSFDFGKVRGAILLPKTKYFTPANMADQSTFLGVLQTATLASGSARIYPISRFKGMEDKSTEARYSESGYGDPKVSDDGVYGFIFDLAEGGMCLNAQLRKFNDQAAKWTILLYDDKNQILGTKDSSGNLWGADLSILHTHKFKFNNGTDAAMYTLEVGLPKPEQINDSFGIFPATFDIENEVLGILDIELGEVAVASGVATISAKLLCGKTNLYDDLSTLLADETLWTVKDSSGAAVVISSVTADAANKAWDIAFTGTGSHTINLASASVLAAAGVGGTPINGYEGIAVTVTMP